MFLINYIVPLPGSKEVSNAQGTKLESVTRHIERIRSRQRYVDIEISSMRKTIAKRLTESKVINLLFLGNQFFFIVI